MEKYMSFKILSVTAKVTIFQESYEPFFVLFVYTTLKWSLWFLHCICIAYQYAILLSFKLKGRNNTWQKYICQFTCLHLSSFNGLVK